MRAVGNPHVRMLYDFYHEQISGGNLIKKLVDNQDLVALVHVADHAGAAISPETGGSELPRDPAETRPDSVPAARLRWSFCLSRIPLRSCARRAGMSSLRSPRHEVRTSRESPGCPLESKCKVKFILAEYYLQEL